jgi:uncharacterized tellurite resistance protein B-like protein
MPKMHPELAGAVLLEAVADVDGDYSDAESEVYTDWLIHKVGLQKSFDAAIQKHQLTTDYIKKYKSGEWQDKLEQDALDVLRSQSLDFKHTLISFARHVGRADRGLSGKESKKISYYCSELGVDIANVPQNPLIGFGAPVSSQSSNSKSGCFIATAAYGTPFAEEIDVLRNWRDDFLEASYPGRAFIRAYYSLSPPVADNISESEGKRKIVRTAIGPIVKILKGKYG